MTIGEVRKAAWDYLVAVTVATEVPPRQPQNGPPYSDEMKELCMMAVIDVIRNRVRAGNFPPLAVEVVLQRLQFSAVCREDYWRKAVAGKWFASHVTECYNLWKDQWDDITGGATYYYSPISMVPPFSEPDWNFDILEETFVEGVPSEYFRFFREKR